MPDFLIRSAAPDDVGALVGMRLALQDHITATNEHLFALAADSESRLARDYLAAIASPDCLVLIAEEIGSRATVGMAVGRIEVQENLVPAKAGRIDNVWVDAGFRRRGICRAMIGRLLDFFEQSGVGALVLDYVVGSTESESTWKELGFHPVLTIATSSLTDTRRRIDADAV